MKRTVVPLMLAVAVSACGYRTPPRPPEDTAPVIAGAVTREAHDDAVVVRWKRAERSTDGMRLDDLASFVVERRRDGEDSWQRVARIDVVDQEKIRRRRDFSWRDEDAGDGRAQYRVLAVCADGQEGAPVEASAAPGNPVPAP